MTFVMLCAVTRSSRGHLTVALCDIFKDVLAAFAAALSLSLPVILLSPRPEFIVTNASSCYIFLAS